MVNILKSLHVDYSMVYDLDRQQHIYLEHLHWSQKNSFIKYSIEYLDSIKSSVKYV